MRAMTSQVVEPSATVPAGYNVRNPTRDEMPAIARFAALCERYDTDNVDFTPAALDLES